VNSKRVIPFLLLRDEGLVKGAQFQNHKYIGDPINAVKIFNEKEVDELVFLDISARKRGSINYGLLEAICSEAFMPFAYGGGISSCQQIERLFRLGVEKVVLNTELIHNPDLLKDAVQIAGSQSIVACVDVRKPLFGGYEICINNGREKVKAELKAYLSFLTENGAGEIVIQSIGREGTGKGMDTSLIDMVAKTVGVPVIASGGAAGMDDVKRILRETDAAAVGAGSMFVFHGKHKAVLITYPSRSVLETVVGGHT
jgi:cyclase